MKSYVFTAKMTSEPTQDFTNMLKACVGYGSNLGNTIQQRCFDRSSKHEESACSVTSALFPNSITESASQQLRGTYCLLPPAHLNELDPMAKNIPCSFQGWIITWESQIGALGCSLF